MSSGGFDWPGLLRLGLSELGLRPGDFWQLTPVELLLLAGASPGNSAAMTRTELQALMERFPDKPGDET